MYKYLKQKNESKTSSDYLKVAHITLSMEMGGIENFILNFAANAKDKRIEMIVVCLDSGGELISEVNKLGIQSYIFKRKPGFDWRIIFTLYRFFLSKKIDVVHTHNQASHFYAAIAAKMCGVPVIITTEHSRHNVDLYFRRRVEKFLLSQITDYWVSVNEKLAMQSRIADKLQSEKIKCIPNGIDILRFQQPNSLFLAQRAVSIKKEIGIPGDAEVIVMVGRLEPVKNHSLLLHAASRLKCNINNIHIVLVGDGPLKNDLKELAKQLDISDRVHFLGIRKDVNIVLWASDVFVLCSKTEGLPLSLLEAMAAKLSIVTTRSANGSGLVLNKINGMVAENDAQSLAECIECLIANTEYRRKLVKTGFDLVARNYSIKKMISQYEFLYRKKSFWKINA